MAQFKHRRFPIIAIPARDEGDRIGACLAALATQRDLDGSPLPEGTFDVVVLANNCVDRTLAVVAAMDAISPHRFVAISEDLPPEKSNAGWARKSAMDAAASRLLALDQHDGLILTTDADSIVGPTWVAATLRAFDNGADAVAGYIDAHPHEMAALGRSFLRRGRLEDRYLRLVAEIYALCDPRPHDPWPNHRVASGASLALTLAAYLEIGGLPPQPVGEDAALAQALENAGFKIRHAMDVHVSTSCRFDGRARGGAADTMRMRHAIVEAPCDDDLEPALPLMRRALLKGSLRRAHAAGGMALIPLAARFGLDAQTASTLVQGQTRGGFEDLWARLSESSPLLNCRRPLVPADLPRQIERASMLLDALRGRCVRRVSAGPADTPDRVESSEPVAA